MLLTYLLTLTINITRDRVSAACIRSFHSIHNVVISWCPTGAVGGTCGPSCTL